MFDESLVERCFFTVQSTLRSLSSGESGGIEIKKPLSTFVSELVPNGDKRLHKPVGVLYLDSSSCSLAGSLGLLSLSLSTHSLKLLADLSNTSSTFHTDTSGKKPFKSVSYMNLLLNTLPITSFHALIVPLLGT